MVIWSAARSAVLQVRAGLLLGIGLAWLAAPLLGSQLIGYEPGDPVAYAAVIVTLLLTGLVAAARPARSALSTDVAAVLRAD